MPLYAALLGHQPHMSLAELSTACEGFVMKNLIDTHTVIFETPIPFPPHIDTLGGVILLAELSPTPPNWSSLSLADPETSALIPEGHALLKNELPSILSKILPTKKRGKVTFSLRTLGLPKALVKDLYRLCKTHLKQHDRASRYIGNEHKPAPPITLHAEGILHDAKGCELFILFDGHSLWVGKTCAAHNPVAYRERDIQKPVRDLTTGLLPPKLAQVMLNFGQWLYKKSEARSTKSEEYPKIQNSKLKTKTLTVYDPFCGSGVIPMEALLRGWPVLASDLSQRAVNATEKNIEWLRKHKKIFKKDVPSTVWKQDATKEFDTTPDLIVTETSLGDPLLRRPSLSQGQTLRRANERLQAAFLTNVAHSLPGIPIVCIWPVWYTKGGILALEKIWETIGHLKYQAILPPNIPPPTHDRPTILYRRPDQFVGREIVLLLPQRKK